MPTLLIQDMTRHDFMVPLYQKTRWSNSAVAVVFGPVTVHQCAGVTLSVSWAGHQKARDEHAF